MVSILRDIEIDCFDAEVVLDPSIREAIKPMRECVFEVHRAIGVVQAMKAGENQLAYKSPEQIEPHRKRKDEAEEIISGYRESEYGKKIDQAADEAAKLVRRYLIR